MHNLSRDAYQEGWEDHWTNLDNPYDVMDNRHYEWLQGKRDAIDVEEKMIDSFFRNGII